MSDQQSREHGVLHLGRVRPTTRLAVRLAVPVIGLSLLASACTSSPKSDTAAQQPGAGGASSTSTGPSTQPQTSQTSQTSSSAPPPAVELSMTPTRLRQISPNQPVTITAKNGTLSSVTMLNPTGKAVTGALSQDKTSWHTTEALGYGKAYKISATATDETGESQRSLKKTLTTLTPANMTMPYLNTIYGAPIQNGAKYGIGMIAAVHFDEPITNKAAAEKALDVTTTPHVDGAWTWADDSTAHWRPKNYYASGTKVTIAAHVYGVNVGGGIYGESDKTVSFTIGRKQVTIATDSAPNAVNKVRTYKNGKLIHTMNTSMGKHGGESVNGQWINFFTMDGAYTVIGFENPARMCSASYGLPPNASGGYPCENIYWSTKISTDGIYLHELDNTTWEQDHGEDVSHGCLNLNHDNAVWFYTHSLVGDPVIIHGAQGAPKLELWQGGDWSVPWTKWLAGSALH